VNGEERSHREREIIVFDDSKVHKAHNIPISDPSTRAIDVIRGGVVQPLFSPTTESTNRIVLILDLLRPSHLPLGGAVGGHTAELDNFISKFN
jgi:hypothetical protein